VKTDLKYARNEGGSVIIEHKDITWRKLNEFLKNYPKYLLTL